MKKYTLDFKKSYRKASSFFGIKPKDIKLKIIEDPEKIFRNKKIPWYAVGFYYKNTVVIVDKELFPSRGHKKNEFSKVMLHEMCHIFIKKIVKKKIPVWIEEGLCQFIAFGDKIKPKNFVDLEKLETYKDWYNWNSPYAYCSNFFSYLHKNYGKRKILEFLESLNKNKPENAFVEVFGEKIKQAEEQFRKEMKKC